jgi:hypothetical protein
MACIKREILTNARPGDAWAAIRDIGALHERLVPGFVIDTRLEPGARIVTFGNGTVVKELIVELDDEGIDARPVLLDVTDSLSVEAAAQQIGV